MESERGIIMIGHCRAGKLEMMHRVLKHCSDINFKGSIEEVKKELQRASLTFNGSKIYIDEAKEIFEEMKQPVIYEKPQSKFISRPRNNFRKR